MKTLLLSLSLIIISPTLFGQSITIGEDGIVRCKDVAIGTTEEISGDTYEVVDRDLLIQRRDEGADLTKVCTSLINDMDRLFYMSVINHDIGNWDVSSVNNMRQMFRSSTFNKDISKWDVSSVTNMSGMFMQSDFNQSISDWNVNSVKDMSSMFSLSKFNGDISSWDVSNVTNLVDMFFSSPFNNDISNWNVSSVTDMSYMFNISSFNQNISNWDVSQVTAMVSMFDGAPFNQDISRWKVFNVTNMKSMFNNSEFNQDISNWCVPLITVEPESFSNNSPLEEKNKPIWGSCPSISIKELNKYKDLSNIYAESLQNHSLLGANVTITALVVSNPTSSGLGGYNQENDQINRTHIFVIDTLALSNGRDGMSFQIVDTNEDYIDSLQKGNIYRFQGRLTFYNVTSQFDLTSEPELIGNVEQDRFNKFEELLRPRNITINEIHEISDNKIILNPDDYSKYNAEYISLSDVETYVDSIGLRNIWLVHNNSSKIWVWDHSLRFRNDRTNNYKSNYNFIRSWASGGKDMFLPPLTGSKIDLSGFLVVHSDDINDNYDGEIFSINPFEDGIFWSEDNIKYLDGESYDGQIFSWNNDLTINSSPANNFHYTFDSPDEMKKIFTNSQDVFLQNRYSDSNHDKYLFIKNARAIFPYDGINFGKYSLKLRWKGVGNNFSIAIGQNSNNRIEFNFDVVRNKLNLYGLVNATVDLCQYYYKDPSLVRRCRPKSGTNPDLRTIPFAAWSDFEIFYLKNFISIRIDKQHEIKFDLPNIDETNMGMFLIQDNNSTINVDSLFFSDSIPLPPKLISPINNQDNVGVLSNFIWEPVDEASSYILEIFYEYNSSDGEINMEIPVRNIKTDSTNYVLNESLYENSSYKWRVKTIGTDTSDISLFSSSESFFTGVRTASELSYNIPITYSLSQNYPNPFNPSTQIQYALPEATQVTLEVFNSVGQKVMELVNGQKSAGLHTASFDPSGLSSGVYLYKLTTPSFTETKKMLLIK